MTRYRIRRQRLALLASAAVSVVGAAGALPAPALAQEAATPAQPAGLAEIVVTARRRAENLQSTPVSVTAINAAGVAQLNVQNFQDLRGVVPLELQPLASGGTAMTIRGIGQGSAQANVDAKAGLYVDEAYISRQEGNQLAFYDIDSLQVLKGPQGTLFGKNTTAGAVLLTTARPSAAPDTSYLKVRLGNFKHIDTEGGINIPISDTLLSRISFRTENTDGYIKHALDSGHSNNVDDRSIRGQLRWRPNSRFTADLLLEHDQSNTDGLSTILIGCNPTTSYQVNYNSLHTVPFCTAYPVLKDPYEVYGGATLSIPTSSATTELARGGDATSGGLTRGGKRNPYNDTWVNTANLRMTYDLTDKVSIKSITALRNSDARFYNPVVNVPNDIYAELDKTHTRQFTQEFNLNGRALENKLTYVAGLFYYRQKTFFLQDTGPDWIDPVGYTFDANNDFESYAAYAQASYKFLQKAELTVGGRYSHDKKTADSFVRLQQNSAAPCNGFINAFKTGQALCAGNLTGADSDSWSSFDPRAQLSVQWTPDLMTYVSYTRGYNAGGFNQQIGSNVAAGKLISYDPEKVAAYEAGFKSEWFDRRLRTNVSVFYQDYQDIQTTLTIIINGVSTRQVQTGATAHEKGIEGDAEWLVTRDFVIRANAAVLKQAYDTIRPGVTAFTLTTPVNAAPKFTYSVSGQYTFHLANENDLVASLDWRAVGKRPSCTPLGGCSMPAYGLLGGRLDYKPKDSNWTIGLWGTNLLDEYAQIAKNISTTMGHWGLTVGRPREYGMDIRRSF